MITHHHAAALLDGATGDLPESLHSLAEALRNVKTVFPPSAPLPSPALQLLLDATAPLSATTPVVASAGNRFARAASTVAGLSLGTKLLLGAGAAAAAAGITHPLPVVEPLVDLFRGPAPEQAPATPPTTTDEPSDRAPASNDPEPLRTPAVDPDADADSGPTAEGPATGETDDKGAPGDDSSDDRSDDGPDDADEQRGLEVETNEAPEVDDDSRGSHTGSDGSDEERDEDRDSTTGTTDDDDSSEDSADRADDPADQAEDAEDAEDAAAELDDVTTESDDD